MLIQIVQADTRRPSTNPLSKYLRYDETRDDEPMMRSLNGAKLFHDWDFWSLTFLINRFRAGLLAPDYAYRFVEMNQSRHFPDRHVTWGKIRVVLELLQGHPRPDAVVFIDSDAWIRDHRRLRDMMDYFMSQPDRHGMFSRDPKMPKNTLINTGMMALKNTAYTHRFLEEVWAQVALYPSRRHEWPHEQFVASQLVEQNLDRFLICKVAAFNTPCGQIVRHAWLKHMMSHLLIDEAYACLSAGDMGSADPFDPYEYLDDPQP